MPDYKCKFISFGLKNKKMSICASLSFTEIIFERQHIIN